MVGHMKSSIASALSVSGVLAAGAIALAANTNVLDGGVSTAKGAPAMAAQVVVPVSQGSATTLAGSAIKSVGDATASSSGNLSSREISGALDANGDSPDTTIPGESPDTTVPVDDTETAYTLPGIGTVNVSVVDGALAITNVDEVDGWSSEIRNSDHGNGYEVIFTNDSDGTTYEFNVALIDGRIVTSIRDITEQPDYPAYEDEDEDEDDDDEYEDHDEDEEDEDHEDEDHEEYEDD